MKNSVIIKSFQNGLSIYLDDEMPFAQLLEEIAFKFKESAHFFKDASMVLSFEGRQLSDEEERQIVNTITDNSSLNVMCIVGKNEETNKNFIKALQKLSYHQQVMENAGQFGQAYAGGDGTEGHFVVALEMSPEKLKIGDFKYKTSEKQGKWPIKPKVQPKIAYAVDGRVIIEPITKELLNDLPV